LLNILLVYWFIRLISQNRLVAGIVALWFGIHPMHVESVAWISERKDVLYTAFFMAGLISWCYYLGELKNSVGKKNHTAGKRLKFYLFSLFFFLLSLLSKSAAVVFPLVLLLIEFLFRRRFSMKQMAEKIPFFALALLFGVLAILSQRSAINRGMDLELSSPDRFFTVNYAFIRYIAMLFYPAGLSAYHPYPLLVAGNRPALIHFSLLFNLIIAGIAVYSLKYSRKWVFGLLFFLVNIILVLQILPFGGAFIAERYTYISYIGLFYILACMLTGTNGKSSLPSQSRYLVIAVFIFFTAFFSISAYRRINVWNDSLSLFEDVVKKYPGNYLAYYLRGSARQEKDIEGAVSDYTKSIELNPRNPKPFNNRGNVFSATSRYKEALADYNAALALDPSLSESLNNRGAVKAILGDLHGAMEDINKALLINPEYRDAYRNRGLVWLRMKDLRSARDDWEKAAGMGDEISVKLLRRYAE
jgi:tetratricopeptide (TPR) repeat protein